MERKEIIGKLDEHGIIKLTTKTRFGTYLTTSRSSLLAQQVSNRSSADWKKAQFVVVDDKDESDLKDLSSHISGWKSVAEEGQFLIINEGKYWNCYDYEGNVVSLDEVISNNEINHDEIYLFRQVIFYGAPGTGKSHKIKKLLEERKVSKENIFRTTFHPDSDYSTFVGAYKPTMKKHYRYEGKVKASYYEDDDLANAKKGDPVIEQAIEYSFIPQAFLNAYIRAYQTDQDVYLIIEEINRGNCAQIFGDLFQLLDRDQNGKSEYTIKADADLKAYLEEQLGADELGIKGGELCLPPNLYIYATMNTSDQSLFPIDSAFKRRWDWEYEPIKYSNTKWEIDIQDRRYSWVSFQKIVNDKIFDATHSEDKMLGDFFVNPGNQIISEKMLVNKILFYLWNDVCKDGEGDIFKVNDSEGISFSQLYEEDGSRKLVDMMAYLKVAPFVADAGTGLEDSIIDDNEIWDQSIKDWYKGIWDDVIDNIRDKVPGTLPSSASRQNYQLSVGITGISAIAKISKQKNNCFIGYYIEKQQSSTLYPKLLAVKGLLEDKLGKLEWQYNEGHYGVAKISKSFSDLSDSEERDKLIEMISETLPEFYNAIIPLIEKLR